MVPRLRLQETIVVEAKFAPREEKMFLDFIKWNVSQIGVGSCSFLLVCTPRKQCFRNNISSFAGAFNKEVLKATWAYGSEPFILYSYCKTVDTKPVTENFARIVELAPVVQKLDNIVQLISHYQPVCICANKDFSIFPCNCEYALSKQI